MAAGQRPYGRLAYSWGPYARFRLPELAAVMSVASSSAVPANLLPQRPVPLSVQAVAVSVASPLLGLDVPMEVLATLQSSAHATLWSYWNPMTPCTPDWVPITVPLTCTPAGVPLHG